MSISREWLQDFIELYRSEPCLWKMKSKEYHDRDRRKAAYDKLLFKLQEIEPDSNRESVVKKINNIRCAYKKEYKKVMTSMLNSNSKYIYKPKLWYYSLLTFLNDQDIPHQNRSNSDDEDNVMKPTPSVLIKSEMEETLIDETSNASIDFSPVTTPTLWSKMESTAASSSGAACRKRNCEASLTKDVLLFVKDHFKRPTPSADDRFDVFGKAVAFKLRDLNISQRIFAEKIINETLAAAELGSLTASHTVMSSLSFQNSPMPENIY